MVCRTRFYSSKGQLLRSILHPREHSEAFVSDSTCFIVFMLVGCMGLYIWAAIVLEAVGAWAGGTWVVQVCAAGWHTPWVARG